jgi:hypothetical protein
MVIKNLLVSDHSEKEMHQILTYADFTIGFVKHILISLTSSIGTPNSARILCNTFLLTESYAFLKSINN